MACLKVVVVGSRLIGKSSLVTAYCEDVLLEGTQTKETFEVTREYDNTEIKVTVWDTSGTFCRPIAYNGADAFILCFDLSNKYSLK